MAIGMGVTRKFSREGHKFQTKIFYTTSRKTGSFRIFRTKLGAFRTNKIKNRRFFARRLQKGGNFVIFRRFGLNLGVFHTSAEGASEKFRVFYRATAYDVIIFKFQGGGIRPPPAPPLLTPMRITMSYKIQERIRTTVTLGRLCMTF